MDKSGRRRTDHLLFASGRSRFVVYPNWRFDPVRVVRRNARPPPLLSETGIGGILEFFGGIAIALGLGTRPVAFILSGTMAVAYWQFHAPNAVSPVQNQGVAAVLFCFLFLYLSARGGGDWSVDAILRPKSKESRTRRN
jgi:uncharacterized membrane protein YphA (DoxX/SURF4 family)